MDSVLYLAMLLQTWFAGAGDDRGNVSAQRSGEHPSVICADGEVVVAISSLEQMAALVQHAELYANATQLKFRHTGVTDEAFGTLPALPAVQVVVIREESSVTDKSLRTLARFPKLQALLLEGTAITGKGFQWFVAKEGGEQAKPPLDEILLAGNKVTDEGLRELARIATLRRVFISREPHITAQGAIEHLPVLEGLGHLVISFGPKHKWTDEQRRRLCERMPRCEVGFGEEISDGLRDGSEVDSDARRTGTR